ncbi:MAG: PAS domain-containing protein [Anaerolineae bacterium]
MSDNASQEILDARAVLDSLGQGVLLFDTDSRLIYYNHAAQHILGANLVVMRAMGWSACANLFDARRGDGPSVNELRLQAFQQAEPVRFHAILSGAHISCWVTAVYGTFGQVYTMVTLERPDWTAFSELMSAFRRESSEAISSAQGHADLMLKILSSGAQSMDAEHLAARASGFAEMVATHLHRLEQFTRALYRLEVIRTDQLPAQINSNRQRVVLDEFIEDYLEELSDQGTLSDPQYGDFRARIQLGDSRNLNVLVSFRI